jgi:hypothetical protein
MSNKSQRNSTVSHSDISEFIISWLNSKIEFIGAQLILQLINHPDEEMDILELAYHLPHHKSHNRTKYPVNQGIGEPFEMADWQTVNECVKEIKRLENQIAADLELGFEEEARRKQEEVQKILAYLKEIRLGNRLRMFPDIRTMEYQRLFNTYKRILKLAENEDPEVARYFRNHIKTGKIFKWISDQVSSIDSLN